MRLLLFLSALLTGLTGALVGMTPVEARQVGRIAACVAPESVAETADHAPLLRTAAVRRFDRHLSPALPLAAEPIVDVRFRIDSAHE